MPFLALTRGSERLKPQVAGAARPEQGPIRGPGGGPVRLELSPEPEALQALDLADAIAADPAMELIRLFREDSGPLFIEMRLMEPLAIGELAARLPMVQQLSPSAASRPRKSRGGEMMPQLKVAFRSMEPAAGWKAGPTAEMARPGEPIWQEFAIRLGPIGGLADVVRVQQTIAAMGDAARVHGLTTSAGGDEVVLALSAADPSGLVGRLARLLPGLTIQLEPRPRQPALDVVPPKR